MKQKIQQKLTEISQEEKIHFLLAIESGSRAWGFPSPDSDYDVRTIFIQPKENYLTITESKSTFEYIENEWFDVAGWDIRKALSLLAKSNPVLLEWLNSPIIYQQDNLFIEQIKPLLNDYFQAKKVIHHYRGIAKSALCNQELNQPIKLKKWLYILRPLLAASWVKREQSIPPMELTKLYQTLSIDLQTEINELVDLKSTKPESYLHSLSQSLIKLTNTLWNEFEYFTIPNSENKLIDIEGLNHLFQSTLKRIE